ncbi:tetratricopeptide repeat-containing sensor histidine kinase [Dyadobacter sp. CY326]|uniref:tetratricopeptide repeat-containing sensor histidine kinase n=1 Tax=Dyadobacter sp. CY326 TaxID=2907300 RepID=UPI001F15B70C|nr:tetratricopeptide repeat-containing sensor histidine kinase [Dyadobacter sp. CY326]MCE7065103.1 tetratricopeptide repeat-containing sensor histidine kinase [Dyadobacter sp. CY326]
MKAQKVLSKIIIKTAFLMALLCSMHPASAQLQGQALIDSLEAAVPRMKNDSNKVKGYSKISQLYYGIDLKKSFLPAEKGLALAEKINWKKGIANINNNLGLFISDSGNLALGNAHYQKSYAINKELNSKPNLVNNLNNIGRNYMAMSDFANAADYFFKALSIAEAIQSDDHIALVGTNLISCFHRQKNYRKAAQYAALTIKHAKLAKNTRHLVSGLMQLGAVKLDQKDTIAAKKTLREALKICEESGNYFDMAQVLMNLSLAEYPNYQNAIGLMSRVDSIIHVAAPGSGVEMNNHFNMAEAYYKLALQNREQKPILLNNASMHLKKAKEMAEHVIPELMVNILLLQSNMEETNGQYQKALASFKRSTAISDSLYSQDKKNEIAGLEGKYALAVKDKEIELNKLLVESQRKMQWALIAGILLLIILGALILWQSRTRKQTNTTLMVLNQELNEANKVKARFFGILSHDLRSPIVNLMHFLELQKDNPDLLSPEDKAEHTLEISESAENLLNTMEAMLLWSKEQMEHFRPNIQPVQVTELFDHIRGFFSQSDRITFKFITEPGLTIAADENYLRTIMQNLTSNAIRALKHTPDATITWEAKSQSHGIALSITDNGPGIEAQKVATLFDTNVMINEKTGFGLHLVRDLAKAIRYSISVESLPGKGTTFTLSS